MLPRRKANQILLSATMYWFQNISKIHCCWQSQNHLFVVCLRIFNLLWLLFSDVGFCRITLKKDWGWVWSAGFWWFWVCLKKWCFQQQRKGGLLGDNCVFLIYAWVIYNIFIKRENLFIKRENVFIKRENVFIKRENVFFYKKNNLFIKR